MSKIQYFLKTLQDSIPIRIIAIFGIIIGLYSSIKDCFSEKKEPISLTEEEKYLETRCRIAEGYITNHAIELALEELQDLEKNYPNNPRVKKLRERYREYYYKKSLGFVLSYNMISSASSNYSQAYNTLNSLQKLYPEKKEELIKIQNDIENYSKEKNELDQIEKKIKLNHNISKTIRSIEILAQKYSSNRFIMEKIEKYIVSILKNDPKNREANDVFDKYLHK